MKIITLDISTVIIHGEARQILMFKDISDIIFKEQNTMQAEFSQKLTASLCHEIMTPLNCIIHVSDILLMQHSMPSRLNRKEKKKSKRQYKFIHSLASSAKFMRLMLCSQLSCTMLHEDQLQVDMKPLDDTMLTFIEEFLQPYHVQARKTQISLEVEIINKIPEHCCTDWVLYS